VAEQLRFSKLRPFASEFFAVENLTRSVTFPRLFKADASSLVRHPSDNPISEHHSSEHHDSEFTAQRIKTQRIKTQRIKTQRIKTQRIKTQRIKTQRIKTQRAVSAPSICSVRSVHRFDQHAPQLHCTNLSTDSKPSF